MLQTENLTYITDSGVKILKNYNLCFDKGITVVTGQNGSGKTTLAKLLMGVIFPSSGKIMYNSQEITNMPINERANLGITIAFQQPVTFKGIKVKEVLNYASKKNNNLSDICSYLSKVGLCARDYVERTIDNSLSGGELKRIELATSLAKGGDVFIFDEPEAGIDIWSFDSLVKIFKSLSDKTVIIISHNKKIIDIADKVVVLNKDNIIEGKGIDIKKILEAQVCKVKRGSNE